MAAFERVNVCWVVSKFGPLRFLEPLLFNVTGTNIFDTSFKKKITKCLIYENYLDYTAILQYLYLLQSVRFKEVCLQVCHE